MSEHWAITLYERYVQLYGEPIEQPIRASQPLPAIVPDARPLANEPITPAGSPPGGPRAQPSAPRSS